MNEEVLGSLRAGFETAYIDETSPSDLSYQPQFISNNVKEGKKVLSVIEDELKKCDHFRISVAFITPGGIESLLQVLKELRDRGVKGEILTTDYLTFSDPKALRKLHELDNITLKMYRCNDERAGFHTKGYIFQDKEIYRIIIGSSNLTANALVCNHEWNVRLISNGQGEITRNIISEFEELWNSSDSLSYDEFIDEYAEEYALAKKKREEEKRTDQSKFKVLKPNSMQVSFIDNLKRIINEGQDRALLISATGTGKTYAAAFAMREIGFKRVLFLVHRNQIAKQARSSFWRVIGNKVSMGYVSGTLGRYEYDKDYIFATVQTFSKDDTLQRYARDHFDAIIYDEAHHSSSASYKKIMEYFIPKLSLGMTATPDKRDDNLEGKNIYEIFDYQIACEIRLQNAMEEDLLCPFHYFGITDLSVIADEQRKLPLAEQIEHFRYLTSDERVNHVMEQANYYGYSGDRVKGLIFCNRVDEARELSRKFNERGWRTVVLSGSDSDEKRASAIERLAGDEGIDALDYILSVDIFSEGVDVPEINQVIMLRPTQSPIVFIQQLGRGLRKAEGKEFVVVLDFIGNYSNNFMIPIALSGDRSYNKDNVRRFLAEGGKVIPGFSTVHFDEVARKRIYQSIDNANFSDVKLIKENYQTLKNKLGHIPALMDFDKYGEMDVLRIFDNTNLGSYYKFLVKYEKEYKVRLSEEEDKFVEFISKKLASGKRVHELELINLILHKQTSLMKEWDRVLNEKYGIILTDDCKQNVINIMTNEFPTGTGKDSYKECIFLEKESYDEGYCGSKVFTKMLSNPEFNSIVQELVDFGISRYQTVYSNRYEDTDLALYQKYTYEDVCRLLNWKNNVVSLNIGGYKYDKDTKTFPVFINYEKTDDISDTTKYDDRFTSERTLIAISKNGRSIESEDVQNLLHSRERGIIVHLFVRKNKKDKGSKEFYYLGEMLASGFTKEFVMPKTDETAVEIGWVLDTPVRDDIYEYIVNG